MNALATALGKALQRLLPTESRLRFNSRHEPEAVAHRMTAGELHDILREAEGGDTRRLFALYRDVILQHGHCQSEFSKRKLAVLGNAQTFQPYDKNDPADVQAMDLVEAIWNDTPGKREALTHLLDSSLYPVAVLEKRFRPARRPGLRYEVEALTPVPHHLLDFSAGRLRIRDVDPDGLPLESFYEPSPATHIVHRGHLLTSIPDNWGGPMRAVLFWWLFATMDREWWARFLERYGAPFIAARYPEGNDAARRALEQALSTATRLFGLAMPEGASVDLVAAAASSHGDAFQAFAEFANAEISKIIVGQTMTAEAKSQGIGGSQAQVHDRVRSDVRDFDSAALGESLRDQLFAQLIAVNGLTGRAPTISWGEVAGQEAQLTSALLQAVTAAGLEISDDGISTISQKFGLPLQRRTGPPPGVLSAFTPDSAGRNAAIDAIAAAGAPGLARAFRDDFADLSRIIRESRSPAELESQLAALCAGYSPRPTLLIQALTHPASFPTFRAIPKGRWP